MTFELRILALSVVLGLVQIVLASHAASLQRGYLWTAGSRDEVVPPLTGIAGRLERALRNFIETFPLFAATVLIAHVTNTHSWMTEWGVQLYFGARVTSLALYAAGVFLLRSLVWNVATLGIAMVLLSLVLNHASAVEHAARSGLYCRSLACDHSFSLGHCTSVQSAFVRNWHFSDVAAVPTNVRFQG